VDTAEGDPRSDYRIPTQPVEAKLIFSEGREEEVTLFLQTASETHSGPESIDEFLNGRRRFIPVKSKSNGKSYLVQRDAIQRVEVGENAPVLSHLTPELASGIDVVRIEMTNAVVLEGTLACFQPPGHRRLSDFFNMDETFIPLEVNEGVAYVNKNYISLVCL
jgi:hypothetical protein